MEKYDPREIEKKAQEKWKKEPDLVRANDASKKEKRFILDMFPYPSGAGLHVGHVESYTATDIYSRYLRMRGFEVLHPQGFDAFGLPAENYAIKTGVHPKATIEKAIEIFKRQIDSMGFSYDWSREVNSSLPEYYKWTQWLFLLFYKNGLAYKKKAKVNWCPKCQTVLANEQAEDGVCERCGSAVVQKDLEQWFFKITDFIEDKSDTIGLLSGLEKVDWPESTKLLQKNWIGKSFGSEVDFAIENSSEKITVYTTRIDTLFSGTYLLLAPEHPLVSVITTEDHKKEIEDYLLETAKKTDIERLELRKEKTGAFTGAYVINPATGNQIPVWISDFVLVNYGTGAVFADAHDSRDFELAKKYNIPLRVSIRPKNNELWEKVQNLEICFEGEGELVNSAQFEGLSSKEARIKITEWLAKKGDARFKVNYKLRDWLVSRQRYWGAPIPIIYCEKCGEVPVSEADLPVELPTDVDFKPTGESPLKYSKTFQDVVCPKCGSVARRESDTMDTFVCSSWYYLRYADPKNEKEFASKELLKKWLPVDLYVGGAEHSVLHLLYARFFTKVLHNLGYLEFDEPFLKLRHQGTILAEDGTKMSKSKGNVVNPDDVTAQFGADALRMFEMFMGPLEDMKPWQTKGIVGVYRFLEKTYKLNSKILISNVKSNPNFKSQTTKTTILLSKTIKKVSEDIESMKFNTAISQLMILANALEKETELSVQNFELFLLILSPFAPHLTEELWSKLGHDESIFQESWPEYDLNLIQDEEIELVIQVNGKVRDTVKVSADISEEEATKLALGSEKTKNHTAGKEIKKIIFVKGRLINVVI
ncbi:MAG: leucine--tRNA ligase [Parcubacteria group bacterium]|jgi:leucyl-tRNA synthetase